MRICFIGDSFVNGTGDPEYLGWVGRVSAAARRRGCDLTCYNLGIRRDASADVARRWRAEAAARLPADIDGRLVFSFGVNDCLIETGAPPISPDATRATAQAILADALRWKPTLFIGPPPIADAAVNVRVRALSQDLSALCRDLRVPYLDTITPLSADAVWMREVASVDGAHPGAPGYARFAALVDAWAAWRAWVEP